MKSKAGVKEETKPRVTATNNTTDEEQTAINKVSTPDGTDNETSLLAGVKEETKPRVTATNSTSDEDQPGITDIMNSQENLLAGVKEETKSRIV